MRLALTLKIVISQVLLRRKDKPGRLAAREILIVTSSVANMIREAKIHQINNVIASSGNLGMALLDDTLLELYQEGVVHASDVMPRLQDPEKARALLAR
jgi:Tfp pilus assembly pilus retraction ATPase PilT